jgi:hypothetical protein
MIITSVSARLAGHFTDDVARARRVVTTREEDASGVWRNGVSPKAGTLRLRGKGVA